MKAKLIPIGNSKGIRIPKSVLDHCDFGDEIELDVRGTTLVLRSSRTARQGWEQAFAKMRSRGDDKLKDSRSIGSTEWDKKEWTW